MKRGKIETTPNRISDRSPRGSISEKSPLIGSAKVNSFGKTHYGIIEDELAQLPYRENELQSLAEQIGIDYETEKDKYLWFLVQVVNLDLPPGWMKEEDLNGTVYYNNPTENTTSSKHPMIAKFRSLFNEILENEVIGQAKTTALKEKVQKLEQAAEMTASPKKPPKEFKLDKAKKFKAAATAIALTTSLAHKTQKSESVPEKILLKSIPDQPQSILDSQKTKDKFNKVKEMLERRRTVQERKVNEVDNLMKTEDILNLCKHNYIEEYGFFHTDAPEQITRLESYDLVDPMELIEAARLFNVRSSQPHLFWALRAYCGLPLPDYWSKVFDANMHREIYYNSCYDVKISVKPCYFYILEIINYIKQESIKDRDPFLHFSNKMTLCDKLGRQYDVDFAAMIKDIIERQNVERKNYFTYHQKKEVVKDESQKVTKKRKKDEFNPNYSDAHFIEIAQQLGIDLETEIHLLMVIENFVRDREFEERWFFRPVQEGPSFWVNHEQQKAVNRYPHLTDLKKIVDEVRMGQKYESGDPKKHLKSEFNLIKTLFRKYPEEVAKKMLQDEAKGYLEFFLKMKNDGQINNINLETKGYNLTNLMRKIGMHLSKSDMMDLLFYCPFDFTQFINEDFLKSSENFLLRKINLKNGDGKKGLTEEEEYETRKDGSFDSQGSNDSAKHIKSKIEDSKKLLDLASNIKGLSLDPEKKREFMKLLIDFDQKYGDRDLVDALEQDIATNIHDGAAATKDLVKSIKNKMGNSIGGKTFDDSITDLFPGSQKIPQGYVESSRDSSRDKIRQDHNNNNNNNNEPEEDFPFGRIKRIGDILTDAVNTSKINSKNRADGTDTPNSSRDPRSGSKKKLRPDGTEGFTGGDQDVEDSIYSAGLAGDARSRKDRKNNNNGVRRTDSKYNNNHTNTNGESSGLEEEGGISARTRRKGEGYINNEKERRHKERRDKKNNQNGDGEVELGPGSSGKKNGQKFGKSGKKKGSRKRGGAGNENGGGSSNALDNRGEEEEESEEDISNDEYSDSESESEYNNVTVASHRTGKSNKKNPNYLRPSKNIYDENGKIIFTNKTTQRLLEELAEEEFRLSSRHQFRLLNSKSGQGSYNDDDESVLGVRDVNPGAFGDHKIVYHEVIMENGEKKIMAINVKPRPRRERRKSNTMSPDTLDNWSRSPNISGKATPFDTRDQKLSRNASKKRLAAEVNQSREADQGLPMVIGSSYKPSVQARNESVPSVPKFDPNVLIESLNRYNVEALDEAYHKEEKKKEEGESFQRLSYVDESSKVDATGGSYSRSILTPKLRPKLADPRGRMPIKIPQTYRALAPGLYNIDVKKSKNSYEKTTRQGAWTHVEVFELKEGSAGQFSERHQRAASETLKAPVTGNRTNNGSPKYAVAEKTFFTPFRKGNLGVKRFIEYMSYLNTLVFMKKLDTLITNFLIKQFTTIQQNALGISFNQNDPTFRSMFRKRYQKLIKQLRENLLKKKDFLNNIYARVFNSGDELPDGIFQSVQHLRETSNTKDLNSNKNSAQNSLIINQNSKPSLPKPHVLVESSIRPPRSSSLKGSKSQQNFHLPKVSIARRTGIDPFRLSQRGFNTPRGNEENDLFTDGNIRNTEGVNEEIPLKVVQDHMSKTSRKGNFSLQAQREKDANNILKSLSDFDQENYRHYWNILGDPLKLESSVIFSRATIPLGIQPYHVLLMARRLGLQVQNSQEHDLFWIAYLALTVKLPVNNEINLIITSPKDKMRFQKVCNMKPGEHPGDKYFKTVLVYNQLRRRILLENMTEEEETRYIKAQSWIKLKEDLGGVYYHNFMTKQKTINLPTDMKEIASKVASLSLRFDIKEKLLLAHQTIMENDRLLTYFKNKLPIN